MGLNREFNPRRLREARIVRGLTISELAEQIGVTKQAISQFELGDAIPKAENMMAIVNTLKFPRVYFYSEFKQQQVGNTFFRARASLTKKTRDEQLIKAEWVAHIHGYLEHYIDFPKLNFPDLSIFDGAIWDAQTIESLANYMRNHWGLGANPISNVPALLEKHGIIVSSIEVGNESIDAFCQPRQGQKPIIMFSSDKQSAARRHFDGAHELGHLLIHKDEVDNQATMSKQEFDAMEDQANRFASAFLLPKEPFIRTVKDTSLEYFIELKKYWKVSIGMMVRRSRDLGIINEQRYTSLQKQISMKRYRKKEPLDDVFPIPEPTVLKQAVLLLLENNIKTEFELIEEIALPANFIESLANLNAGTLSLKEYLPAVSLKQTNASRYF